MDALTTRSSVKIKDNKCYRNNITEKHIALIEQLGFQVYGAYYYRKWNCCKYYKLFKNKQHKYLKTVGDWLGWDLYKLLLV